MQSDGDGIITSYGQIYQMLVDQANLMGVDNHWLDPDRPSGQMNQQTGQPMTVAEAAKFSQAQAAQRAAEEQRQQMQQMIQAQMAATAAQEDTKRVSDQLDAQQKQLDTILDYVTKMTKLEIEAQKDLPGGALYPDTTPIVDRTQ